MSAAAEDRESERRWLTEQQHTVHDQHDAESDPESLPPFGRALVVAAVLLVAVCAVIGYVLPHIANRVFQ